MNAILLFVLTFYCEGAKDRGKCMKEKLVCVAARDAYSMTERRATRVVGECLVEEVKP